MPVLVAQVEPTYDALLIVSFGGPEGMNDVMPFLENVLRGRNVPHERMLQVASRYQMFDGISPLNEQNRRLIAALEQEFESSGPHLPIYWGNRNWHPMLRDTIAQMARDGIKRALAFVTSAYSSYSSCRQYLENIASAREAVGTSAPCVDKIRAFYNHPLFLETNLEMVRAALENIPKAGRSSAELLFTAHSIPQSMAENCEYENQIRESGRLIAESLGHARWRLAFQSRSGQPTDPWLGPDILVCLRELRNSGATNVVIAPIGFVSDHMEIVYDIDVEAKQLCDEIGLNMQRAATAGTHPLFIKMIRELVLERLDTNVERRFIGDRGPSADCCAPGCCMPGH